MSQPHFPHILRLVEIARSRLFRLGRLDETVGDRPADEDGDACSADAATVCSRSASGLGTGRMWTVGTVGSNAQDDEGVADHCWLGMS